MKIAATIALVPQLSTGPWLYWHNLEESIQKIASLGYNGIELFTAEPACRFSKNVSSLTKAYNLEVCAVGTGAGKVLKGLTLTDANPDIRKAAIKFISDMMEWGAGFNAPAIIGSMQGSFTKSDGRELALGWLAEGLSVLDELADKLDVPLIYEPLNRYETNLINTVGGAVSFLEKNNFKRVKVLADLFHMNIEEASLPAALLSNINHIGHVHLADSNRGPAGYGHTDMKAIGTALMTTKYGGYVSAEAFPLPDTDTAAKMTIQQFDKYFVN